MNRGGGGNRLIGENDCIPSVFSDERRTADRRIEREREKERETGHLINRQKETGNKRHVSLPRLSALLPHQQVSYRSVTSTGRLLSILESEK